MNDILAVTSKIGWGIIDIASGEYTACDAGRSSVPRHLDFFGITWDENYLYTLGRQADHIKMFDKKLNYIANRMLPIKLSDGHQIIWINRHQAFALTDAEKDIVVIFDPNTNKATSFHIHSQGIDETHVNSLYFDETTNRLYVNCHNKGNSCIKIFNFSDLTQLIEEKWIGAKSHNIWFNNEQLTICSSGGKQIVDETGNIKFKSYGFVRGVAVTNDRIYAGQSGWRTDNGKYEFSGIGKHRCASIAVLDKTYALIDEIFMPLRIKEIFDIRILNRFDYSHNRPAFWDNKLDIV